MERRRGVFLLVGAFILSSPFLGAQSTGAAPAQGFSAQALVTQLSLYLPEESTRGMYAGSAGRGGQPQSGGARAGQSQGGGARAGQTQNGGQGAPAGGRGFPQIQFTRDPKLFLTGDQITRLLPVLIALKDNPLPSPSRAKKVEAEVNAVLTDSQKAEYDEYRKQMQKVIEQFRQQMSANAGTGSSGSAGAITDAQGDPGLSNTQQRAAGGTPQASLRQRQLEAFIAVLRDRLKQISG